MSAQRSFKASRPELGRLKNRRDFLRLRSGRKISTGLFTLQMMHTESKLEGNAVSRIGFTVTKRVGNAVERNRIKRRLRNAADQVLSVRALPGHDYCIIARRPCLNAPHDSILQNLKQALDHLQANRAKSSVNSSKTNFKAP